MGKVKGGLAIGVATIAGLAGAVSAWPGPDVVVADVSDVVYCGTVGVVTAYAVGTNACNAGTAPVNWTWGVPDHPVIAQNIYRLKGGRFEQLGAAWVKHGFASENGNFCATCQQPPGGNQQLGVGCSDLYDANTNTIQALMGPRWQVNPTTGVFPFPYTAPGFSNAIDRRVQVFTVDVEPGQNPGALYFAEGIYVAADDAQAGNALNNASWRQISIPTEFSHPPVVGASRVHQPAIHAWKEQDPGVSLVSADYVEGGITVRFWVAGRATNNGDGTWRYEYAVLNHNSDRAAGRFSVFGYAGPGVTNFGFHAPTSHSGSPFDNSPWTAAVVTGAIEFSTTAHAVNPDANAIRWGTLYNFRFDAPASPVIGNAAIGLFAPGTPESVAVFGVPVPGAGLPCYPNCDGSTEAPILNVNDYLCFLNRYAAEDPAANCDGSSTPPVLNVNDFACFMNAYAVGCR